VRFGAISIHVPLVLKPAATEIRLLLWALQLEKEGKLDLARLPSPPGQGLTSAPFDRSTPRGFYGVCGYRICGSRVVRIDMLERLTDLIRDRVFWRPRIPEEPRPQGSVEGGGFSIVPDMMSLVGCSGESSKRSSRASSTGRRSERSKKAAAVSPATSDTAPATEDAVSETGREEAVTDPAQLAVPEDPETDPPAAGFRLRRIYRNRDRGCGRAGRLR
jgi:ATP-dependent RNA helicase SUPV3L1/SUV3